MGTVLLNLPAGPSKYTDSNVTLLTASWVGTAAPYTYDLSIPTSYDYEIHVNGATITDAQLAAIQSAQIVDNFSSNLILAKGEKPTIDIPVIIRKWKK